VGASATLNPGTLTQTAQGFQIQPRKREYGSLASQNSIIQVVIDFTIQEKTCTSWEIVGFHKFREQRSQDLASLPLFQTLGYLIKIQNLKSPMNSTSTSLSRPETDNCNDFNGFNEEGYLSISSNLHISQVVH
jgi:hypothetical protein